MGARGIAADGLREALRKNGGYAPAEIGRIAKKLKVYMRKQRAEAFKSGRRVGYRAGLEDGKKLSQPEREAIYAAGFAEGAGLASKRRGNR